MGVSTNGQICYGVMLADDEMPWDNESESGQDGFEEWWTKQCGFKHSFEIYNKEGNYLDGIKPTEDVIRKYHNEYSEFLKNNEPPFELVMHCSGDYPMFILAVKNTTTINHRGYPVKFDPTELEVPVGAGIELLAFCKQYEISIDEENNEPGWYLSSLRL